MLLSDRHLAAPVKGRPWTSGVVSLVGAGHEVGWQHWGLDSAAAAGGWKEQEVDPRRGPQATRARPLLPALSSALTG